MIKISLSVASSNDHCLYLLCPVLPSQPHSENRRLFLAYPPLQIVKHVHLPLCSMLWSDLWEQSFVPQTFALKPCAMLPTPQNLLAHFSHFSLHIFHSLP
jgi:hypothetical protein